ELVGALQRLPRGARGIRAPLGPGGQALVSADGRSALVTLEVAGPHGSADATVAADLAAVAAVQASHHGLVVAEAIGDRVAIAWLGYACGECRYCNDGWGSAPIVALFAVAVLAA